jgi:MFS family permease
MLVVLITARLALGISFQAAGSAAPFLSQAFDASLADVGMLVGIFMTPGVVLALPAGALGARFGDKRIVLIGLTLMVIGSVASGLSTSWLGVVVSRVVTGAGAVFLQVLMMKMAFDWFVGTRELLVATSLFIVGWPVGHAIGQAALTAAAATAGWSWAFYGAAAGCAVALTLLATVYAPPALAAARVQMPLSTLTRREFRLVTLAGLFWMALNGAYVIVLGLGPEMLIERGVQPVEAATAASMMPWAFLLALPLGAWVATRWDVPNLIMVLALAGSAILAFWISVEAGAIEFLAFGLFLAFGTATVAALPSEALREESRSTGLGYYFVWYFIGSATFPTIGGWVGDVTGTAAGPMILAGASLVMCLALLRAFRIEQQKSAVSYDLQ